MISELKKNIEQKMQKSVEALKADLAKVRTGRVRGRAPRRRGRESRRCRRSGGGPERERRAQRERPLVSRA